jgi:hypothetical protein
MQQVADHDTVHTVLTEMGAIDREAPGMDRIRNANRVAQGKGLGIVGRNRGHGVDHRNGTGRRLLRGFVADMLLDEGAQATAASVRLHRSSTGGTRGQPVERGRLMQAHKRTGVVPVDTGRRAAVDDGHGGVGLLQQHIDETHRDGTGARTGGNRQDATRLGRCVAASLRRDHTCDADCRSLLSSF